MRRKFDPDIEMAVFRRGGWLTVSARLNMPIAIIQGRAIDRTRGKADRAGLLAMIRSLPVEERKARDDIR